MILGQINLEKAMARIFTLRQSRDKTMLHVLSFSELFFN